MNSEYILSEIEELIKQANKLLENKSDSKKGVDFQCEYNDWYTKSFRIVKRYLPDRIDEFSALYESTGKIKDFFLSHPYSSFNEPFILQIAIFASVPGILSSFYQNMDAMIYFEYQEDELNEANKLLAISVRAAGAVAGVVLEKHLKRLCSNNGISGAEEMTLGKLIPLLSTNGIISVTENKKLTYLADIRNKCDHAKKEEPREDEVKDLIDQTRRFINLKN